MAYVDSWGNKEISAEMVYIGETSVDDGDTDVACIVLDFSPYYMDMSALEARTLAKLLIAAADKLDAGLVGDVLDRLPQDSAGQ